MNTLLLNGPTADDPATLPIPALAATRARPTAAPPRRRVLVVEDDPPSLRALRVILTHAGWDVTTATTVAEAMRHLAGEDRAMPESVVLDLMLPDGDGAAVLRHIRQRGLAVRVTVTTGIDDPGRLARLESLAPEQVLRKPIDVAELLKST